MVALPLTKQATSYFAHDCIKVEVSLPPVLYRRYNLWADKHEITLEEALKKVLQEAVYYDMMELGSFYQE